MITKTMASEVQDNNQQDQTNSYDPKHLHPAWRARSRCAIGVEGQVHSAYCTRHYVHFKYTMSLSRRDVY
jgi:hypothetical protein